MRDYHNERLTECCLENEVPLVDIASKLRDEHFGDELHPNDEGRRSSPRRSSGSSAKCEGRLRRTTHHD